MQASRLPLDQVPLTTFNLIQRWRFIEPKGAVQNWLWDKLSRGPWQLLDVLGLLVDAGTTYSAGAPPTRTISKLSIEDVEDLLGVERVISELGDNLDQEINLPHRYEGIEPTPENKRLYALMAMRREAKRRASQQTDQDDNQSESYA